MATRSDGPHGHTENLDFELAPEIRFHIGRMLASTYDDERYSSAILPKRMEDLLTFLTAELAKQADQDAELFRADFLALLPNLQRFALSLTKNQARADDLVQDTMLRAWRSRSSYTVGTNLGAWLFTIMRNNFYSSCRRNSQEVLSGDDDHANEMSVLPDQLCRLDLQDVQRAIKKLPVEMREALSLVAIENKTYEAAAAIMKCQIGTVKSRVWRARERLTQILGYGGADLGVDHVTRSAMSSAAF
ncbi:sigma-70 family RNA polymerase sigma factor [Methylobacterium sp. C25]|uniref:sigma-70 family RNA polymerase sigma factor n=1 Tax=Methylobacterium sp. C25 TaxID=2721622 RepID=UPI001F32ECE3|nr:sigma-70 family RNA polymerase sigma factor [Methylobacterium sp. C25]MCE4226511.1 sigma-70 family RNA polymerase sigma factor [Methylobacterium sp. C25]